MDTSVPDIKFDENGICNVCKDFEKRLKRNIKPTHYNIRFNKFLHDIIRDKRDSKYDVVLGISGGLDSTYLTWLCYKTPLRVLLVHIDGGWDSELSKVNIGKVVEKTTYDIETVELPAEELKELTLAYMRAGVMDTEAPFDHAVPTILYRIAEEYGVKYIFTAANTRTEGLMPQSWRFQKTDDLNIQSIYHTMTGKDLVEFPLMSPWKEKLHYRLRKKIKMISPLDMLTNYDRDKALDVVMHEFGWKDYGGKNYEYLFTRFDKAYMQPKRFGIDKRRALYSALIMNGIMSRDHALELMNIPPASMEEIRELRKLFLDKMGLDDEEFERLMALPVRSHTDFDHRVFVYWFFRTIKRIKGWL
jgi:hypothetical protein